MASTAIKTSTEKELEMIRQVYSENIGYLNRNIHQGCVVCVDLPYTCAYSWGNHSQKRGVNRSKKLLWDMGFVVCESGRIYTYAKENTSVIFHGFWVSDRIWDSISADWIDWDYTIIVRQVFGMQLVNNARDIAFKAPTVNSNLIGREIEKYQRYLSEHSCKNDLERNRKRGGPVNAATFTGRDSSEVFGKVSIP